jgi:hypothetical protein
MEMKMVDGLVLTFSIVIFIITVSWFAFDALTRKSRSKSEDAGPQPLLGVVHPREDGKEGN